MELVLKLKPEEELQMRMEADSSGLELAEYAHRQLFGTGANGNGKLSHQKREEKEAEDAEPKRMTPTMALIKSWLEQDATDDPEEILAAEADLLEFKRNMNLPRKEAGARLHYPEAE